jgi:hypothetical protein
MYTLASLTHWLGDPSGREKASFHSGKLFVDWNGQENFSLSCELWVGTNDFNTKKNVLVRSNPRIYNFPECRKLAFTLPLCKQPLVCLVCVTENDWCL